MPKLSVGALTVAQTTQRSANVIFLGGEEPLTPPVETFYIVTNNNEPVVTNTNDKIIYGT